MQAKKKRRRVSAVAVEEANVMTGRLLWMAGIKATAARLALVLHSAPRNMAKARVEDSPARSFFDCLLSDAAAAGYGTATEGPEYERDRGMMAYFLEKLPAMPRRKRRALERAVATGAGRA